MIELSLPPKTPSIHGDSAAGVAGFGDPAGVAMWDAQPSSSELDELEDDEDASASAAFGFSPPFAAAARFLLRLTGAAGGRSCLINCVVSLARFGDARRAPP